jgi:hypothetical protein
MSSSEASRAPKCRGGSVAKRRAACLTRSKKAAPASQRAASTQRVFFTMKGGYFLALALMVTLCACGKRLREANLEAVQPDMTTKEVESVLGHPTRVKTHELTLMTQMKTLPATRYYYEQNGNVVELIFVNDKLVGKYGHFEQ